MQPALIGCVLLLEVLDGQHWLAQGLAVPLQDAGCRQDQEVAQAAEPPDEQTGGEDA